LRQDEAALPRRNLNASWHHYDGTGGEGVDPDLVLREVERHGNRERAPATRRGEIRGRLADADLG
jgi:hypothetical protein